MANTRDAMFNTIETGAVWEAGVVFKRLNGIPLDPKSVFKTKAELDDYAKNDGTAYPSQLCAVIDEDGTVKYYGIDGNGNTVAIGGDVAADLASLTTRVGNAEDAVEALEEKVGEFKSADLDAAIKANAGEISKNATAIADEKTRAEAAEKANTDAITAEATTARAAEKANADAIDVVEADVAQLKLDVDAAESAHEGLAGRVTTAEGKIATAEGKITTLEGKMETAESDIDTLQTDLDTTEGKITTVEGKVTTLEGKMTTAEGEIDQLQADVDAVEAKVATLVGEDTDKSARAIAAEEVAKVVANAPEDFDTLKEMSDWLSGHETDAAGMNSAIQDNATAISNEVTRAKAAEGVNAQAIADEAARADAAEKANAKAISDHATEAAQTYETKTDASAKLAEAKKHATDLDSAMSTRVGEVEADVESLGTDLNSAKSRIDTLEGEMDTVEGRATAVEGRATALEGDMTTAKSDIAQLKTDVDAVEEDVADHETRLATAESDIDAVEAKASSNEASITNLSGRLDGIVAQGGEPNVINNIKVDGVVQTITDKTVNIDLANATVATAGVANSTKGKLSIGGKSFNGASDVTVTAADLGALTSVPVATGDELGLVKSTDAQNGVAVGADGSMTVNTISGSKVSGSVASAAKVDNQLTIGGKTFDGSEAVNVTTDDLGVYTKGAADSTFVKNTARASADAFGLAKADGVTITAADGVLTAKLPTAATQSAAGLMSADDKTKLDGIADGANKTIVDASLSATSTNPVENKAVKAALDTKVDAVSGKGLSTNDFTTAEKDKLAGIAEGANNYSLPTASANVLGGVKIGKNINIADGVISVDDAVVYSEATQSAAGLMSAADKKAVDSISTTVSTAVDAAKEELQADIDKNAEDIASLGQTKANASDLTAVSNKVNTLVGSDADKSARAIAAEEVAKVVAGAPEDLNTLAEIAAWIEAHPESVAEMQAAIDALEAKLEGVDSTVVAYVAAAIDALKIGEYAKAADLTALAARVSTLEAKPDYVLPAATTTTLGGIKVGTNLTVAADGTLSAVDTTYTEATTSKAGLMSAADKGKVDAIATDISSAVSAAKTELNTAIGKKADSSTVTALTTRVDTAESEIDDLQSVVTGFTGEGSIKSYVDSAVASATMEWGTI